MKYILSVLLLGFVIVMSICQKADAKAKSVDEVSQFIKSKNACVFSAGKVYKYPKKNIICTRRDDGAEPGDFYSCGGIWKTMSGYQDSLWEVLCIFDGIQNQGTINEWHGCLLGYYDVSTAQYTGLHVNQNNPYSREFIRREGPCTPETVKAILDSNFEKESRKTHIVAIEFWDADWGKRTIWNQIVRSRNGSVAKDLGYEFKVILDKFGIINPALAESDHPSPTPSSSPSEDSSKSGWTSRLKGLFDRSGREPAHQ